MATAVQGLANKIAPESGDTYTYPGCEFACSGICCIGCLCPCIAVMQNWNAAEGVAKERAETFDNKGLLLCLMQLVLYFLFGLLGTCVGAFVQRMLLAKAMGFESYGPCPDLCCSLCCQPCTYHQDFTAVEQYKARPQKGLVGAAMGAAGSIMNKMM